MRTVVRSATKEVTVAPEFPTVIIGERINPTGKKLLAASLAEGDMSRVRSLAKSQIENGAHILDINVGAAGVDEVALLPMAVKAVQEITDLPLCLDSPNAAALKAALDVYDGKALINSVNGEEASLNRVLPLVKEYGAAVIGLTMDDSGIPQTSEQRVAVAKKIVERAEALGIPREDILIDCLVLTVSADQTAAKTTLDAICGVRTELGMNMSLGASNVSFGLPDREDVNSAFLAMAIALGVNAPIVNPAHACKTVKVSDLLLGKDEFGMSYVSYCRRLARARQA